MQFDGYSIENYDEAVLLALEAHKQFYNVEFIGWDIAMSEHGPCIVEGNDNWEVTLMQAADHPLKTEWIKAVEAWKTSNK